MTNQLIIFGEQSHPPRICESQTSKISVLDLALAYRAWVLKIQNGHHKTQNTRNKGSLIFYSYSTYIHKLSNPGRLSMLVYHRKKVIRQREEMRQIFKFLASAG